MGGDYERMGAGEDSLRSKFVVVLLMKGVVWLVTTGTCSLERLEGGSKVNHNIGSLASDVGRNNSISDPISRPKFPSIFVIILSS